MNEKYIIEHLNDETIRVTNLKGETKNFPKAAESIFLDKNNKIDAKAKEDANNQKEVEEESPLATVTTTVTNKGTAKKPQSAKAKFIELGVIIPHKYEKYFKKGKNKYNVTVPGNISFKEKEDFNQWMDDNELYSKTTQSGTPGNPGFYGGLVYDDYVDEFISKFDPEMINESKNIKRKLFQKYLGLKDDWEFRNDTFNEFKDAFNTKFNQKNFRQLSDSEDQFGWDHRDAIKNAIPPLTKTTQAKETTTTTKDPSTLNNADGSRRANQDITKKDTGWWLQDKVNLLGSLTDKINRYEPTQAKVDLQSPDYTITDPTRRLAASQEQMARFLSQVENTVDGNVGLGAALGMSGRGFENAANTLAQVENQNVGIANQSLANEAAISNKEDVFNEQGRVKYMEDLATLNQNYDDARSLKKWRTIGAFNNGVENHFKKKWMEEVLFPNVNIDGDNANVSISKGKSVYDIFPPTTSEKGLSSDEYVQSLGRMYDDLYQKNLATSSDKASAAAKTKWMIDSYIKGNK